MIDALIHGRLIRATETDAGPVEVRLAIDPADEQVHIIAHRGPIKRQLLELPQNCPLAVAGRLRLSIGHGKHGPFVARHLEVFSILTAEPSFLRRLARNLTGE